MNNTPTTTGAGIPAAQNFPQLAGMAISSPDDAAAFLRFVAENDIAWHFDDDVREIMWHGAKAPTPDDVEELARLSREMWAVVSPWEMLEQTPILSSLFFPEGNE